MQVMQIFRLVAISWKDCFGFSIMSDEILKALSAFVAIFYLLTFGRSLMLPFSIKCFIILVKVALLVSLSRNVYNCSVLSKKYP